MNDGCADALLLSPDGRALRQGISQPHGQRSTAAHATQTLTSQSSRLCAGPLLPPSLMADVRRRMVLEGCKWDPQVGDVATLAPFPLWIDRHTWSALKSDAEAMAAEVVAAEREVLARPELHRRIGVPRRIRGTLREVSQGTPVTPQAARIMRFDFHPTSAGWAVSECNADVPGGFAESSQFSKLMASCAGGEPLGDVTAVWVDALISGASRMSDSADRPLRVALLAAPGFMEDLQIVALLGCEFRRRGHLAWTADPRMIDAAGSVASLRSSAYTGPLDLIIRFYQGEWLARLPARHWRKLLVGGRTPVANGVAAIIGESKRLPLVWDDLQTPCPTWRRLLPETREVRAAPWQTDPGWLLKGAYGNNGDEVVRRDLVASRAWRRAAWHARLFPKHWLAQRWFDSVPLDTPLGPMHVCIGVFVIDGIACGAYGRMSPNQVIDYCAIDVAVLLREETEGTP
jgi:hypothetical protein